MVEISEISIDAAKEGSNQEDAEVEPEEVQEPEAVAEIPDEPAGTAAKEGSNQEDAEVEPEEVQEPEAIAEIPDEPAGTAADLPPSADPEFPKGKAVYNDHALRVAYIMQSYFSPRPSDVAGGGGDLCGAMMEVVRTEAGRWSASNVVLEHSHQILMPGDPTAAAEIIPMVGKDFESISMAKAFYSAYSDKMGFKAKTGSGRRSKDTRTLILQRFFCSHGDHSVHGSSNEEISAKKKRGPYKKKSGKEGKKDVTVVEVVPVDTSDEQNLESGGIPEEDDEGARVILASSVGDSGKDGALDGKDGAPKGKVPLAGNPGQSRLLRELGIRVSKYSNEERRDIILKYMKKRNNRQVVDRSIKVPSRQALAGRRRRGFGGKFLSKEEMQNPNRTEDIAAAAEEEELEVPAEVIANAAGAPVVGMFFENEDKAYEYYINYAGDKGFGVRKGWWDKSVRNITRSRVYVCSREGVRPKNSGNEAKKSYNEGRTGCPARMAIKMTSSGRYRVIEFVPDHNHQLAAPLDIQMLKSQKLLVKAQPGGTPPNASMIPSNYKNYVRAKRMKDMKKGDAQAKLEFLQKKKAENPSFYYAIQVDEDDQMTNIFWADARSMMDYYYFGDVVCLDSSYKPNGYGRPFVQFIGVNHHKQAVMFGAAFLYDESAESFKWLLETFKAAMCGKQPKTVFTDQCAEMTDTVAAVWPGTDHRLCVWQIYQNAVKHLAHVFQGSEAFVHDFSHCIYDFEDEEEFLTAWETMLDKFNIKDNEWLTTLFEIRDKWASVYGRQAFCADLQSTLRGENFSMLKEYLNPEVDLLQFFKQYESLVEERRNEEVQADYHANLDTSRLHLRLLWQAANVYTPAVFEMFRRELELCMDYMVYSCGEVGTLSEYEVTFKGKSKAHIVRFDSSDGTVFCTCKMFEFVGIQCGHVLKILDFRNIKELPPQCILQRWRKDAKTGSLRDNHGFVHDADRSSSISKRYNSLCRILYKIAERAAESNDAFMLMVSHSDQLLEQVEGLLQAKLLERPSTTNANKGQTANSIDNQSEFQDCINENQQVNGKKKKDVGTRRRHQNGLDMNNKRQRVRKGQPDEAEPASRDIEPPVVLNDVPTQIRNPSFFAPGILVQGSNFTGHQFGLGPSQSFQAMVQYGHDSSAAALQQSFHVGTHLNQNAMQGYPTADMHPLQFIGNNPQLDHQSSDQGNQIVWDFL